MLRRSGGAGNRWMREISEASEWFQGSEVEDAFLNVGWFICMTTFPGSCSIRGYLGVSVEKSNNHDVLKRDKD
jgi:hypothetical protein